MVKIACVIVHNKTDAENKAQIDFIKPFIVKQVDHHSESTDPYGNVTPAFDTYYYKIKNLDVDHEVKFYQIVPYGVKIPPNLDEIDSHKVYYGKGDEDKTGNHPRFFNWGLKRGTDYGADLVIYLDTVLNFTVNKLKTVLSNITAQDLDLLESNWGKVGTVRLLRKIGQLDEKVSLTTAFADLKTRIISGGLKYG